MIKLAPWIISGFRSLPSSWRERIKQVGGALGHHPGWAQRLRARQLAATRKRLDRAAAAVNRRLSTAGIRSLAEARCLEFGTGHLLSEALVYHLLGAKRIVAVDYFPILQEEDLRRVCDGVDVEAVIKALKAFEDPAGIRSRLDALMQRRDWTLAGLVECNITYLAPYDAAQGPIQGETFEMIFSASILEHVPAAQASRILRHLFDMLAPGGTMVHYIHLEDHRDFKRAPFAFLADDTDWTEDDADSRGNRLRASDWERLARALPGGVVEVHIPKARSAGEAPLPKRLSPAFAHYDAVDLRTGHLTVTVKRPKAEQ